MKNIHKNILKTLGSVCAIALITVACDDKGYDDYSAGGTPSEALNGEWLIDVIDEASGTVYVEHALHRTFDGQDGKMVISDQATYGDDPTYSGWYLVSEVDYNVKDLTFSATNADNAADGSIVNITDGKILKGAGHSVTGHAVDSIYFKGEFDYDPGTIIIFSGTRRTGFPEDE